MTTPVPLHSKNLLCLDDSIQLNPQSDVLQSTFMDDDLITGTGSLNQMENQSNHATYSSEGDSHDEEDSANSKGLDEQDAQIGYEHDLMGLELDTMGETTGAVQSEDSSKEESMEFIEDGDFNNSGLDEVCTFIYTCSNISQYKDNSNNPL